MHWRPPRGHGETARLAPPPRAGPGVPRTAKTIPSKRSLWETRRSAERALGGSLRSYSDLLSEAFASFDVCADRLGRAGAPFGPVCAVVLTRARNLALGCYSLALDALAQEAGALLRPLVECLEALEYLRQDPHRAAEAVEARQLPQAGVIAQRIQGKLKGLLDHLNAQASHLSGPGSPGRLRRSPWPTNRSRSLGCRCSWCRRTKDRAYRKLTAQKAATRATSKTPRPGRRRSRT